MFTKTISVVRHFGLNPVNSVPIACSVGMNPLTR